MEPIGEIFHQIFWGSEFNSDLPDFLPLFGPFCPFLPPSATSFSENNKEVGRFSARRAEKNKEPSRFVGLQKKRIPYTGGGRK